jgi:tRNA (adenine58-N1)-methyltransferase non-catalytic subunit
LRFETLAQILSQSGIHAGTHVLIVESLVGMLVGAAAYRMRGQGRILAMYGSQQPHMDIVRNYNLATEYINIIEVFVVTIRSEVACMSKPNKWHKMLFSCWLQTVPAFELGPAAKDICRNGFADIEQFPYEFTKKSDKTVSPEELEELPNRIAKKKRRLLDSRPNEKISSTGRSAEAQLRNKSYLRQGVDRWDIVVLNWLAVVVYCGADDNNYPCDISDRLIIACKYRPLPILKQALYLLAPSSPFVIFHEFLEPLIDCFLYLQESGLAVKLQLFDSWLREFQTLPGRMRPEMFMTTNGGFILSGIYVGMVPCVYPFASSNLDKVDVDIDSMVVEQSS